MEVVVVECISLQKGLRSWKHGPESVAEVWREKEEKGEWKRVGGWSWSM